jgi:tetrahydromethanopterin S-methyltransferase subunit G|tara:strand:- start:732 stop:914 length:183 start_codon:yes stop_codon:yes gene_type:complete
MGRAIDQEKEIDKINMRLSDLAEHVRFLQETVIQLVEYAQGKPDEPKKKATKKKTTKSSK